MFLIVEFLNSMFGGFGHNVRIGVECNVQDMVLILVVGMSSSAVMFLCLLNPAFSSG